MEPNSALKLKRVAWASAGVLVAVLLFFATRSGAKPTLPTTPAPVVEVAPVQQKDVPVYGEWIGTLAGQVNANVKAQVSGYLLTRNYKEGSYVKKGELLFEIDPRPFQAALDQAKGQVAQAQAQLGQYEAQLATAQANEVKSQLDVEKYGPLAKADAVSKQDLDNAVQTNVANKAQVQAANAAIGAAKAQIQANQAAVETATINLNFTRIASPIDGIAGIAKAQVGDLVSSSSGVLTTVSTLDPIRDYFTDRQVNQNTGSIQLAALFSNPGNALRPGEYGKIRAVMRTQRNALLVPQAAVTEQQGSYLASVIGND